MLIIFIERLFRSGRIQRPLLPLQRTFRGHRSRYLALGKERSQMEKWVRAFFTQLLRWHVHTRRPLQVNMWMRMVQAGIDGEVAR